MCPSLLATAEALGQFGGYGELPRELGRAAFVAALGVTGFIERVQFRLRFLESRTWWASNGRDVLNAVAFGLLFGASLLIGFSGPLSLVIAGTLLVLVNTVQSALGTRRGATRLSIALAFVLGLPVAIAPLAVDDAFRRMLVFLFRL